MVDEQLKNILATVGLSTVRRTGHKDLWEKIFSNISYKPVAYSNASLEYQFAYQYGHGGNWEDISFIIYFDNKPVALWPLSFSVKEEQSYLTSQGAPVLPPIFITDCPNSSRKRIIKSCLDFANLISIATKISSWESAESFANALGMSDWHIETMARNSLCNIRHELFIDLRPSIAEIKKAFRKSYKSLVTSGAKIWTIGVLESQGDESVWQEFRNLHLKVSGRVTRSDETWLMQYQDIERQCAFLVWLKNSAGEMVGGGLFSFTSDEGLYSVGAYDRSLFDKPLGHVVQYRAIEELKKRGVVWYKLGARPYISDTPKPTDKEISIGEFKQGFASHLFPLYCMTHKVVGDATS